LRGKRLFDDPARGDCASCHIDSSGVNGGHLLLADIALYCDGMRYRPSLSGS
jgi:cytochrome c peroxidase